MDSRDGLKNRDNYHLFIPGGSKFEYGGKLSKRAIKAYSYSK